MITPLTFHTECIHILLYSISLVARAPPCAWGTRLHSISLVARAPPCAWGTRLHSINLVVRAPPCAWGTRLHSISLVARAPPCAWGTRLHSSATLKLADARFTKLLVYQSTPLLRIARFRALESCSLNIFVSVLIPHKVWCATRSVTSTRRRM